MKGITILDRINPKCKCPNHKCPNHGRCKECILYHHKGLHTYCRAGNLERLLRDLHAKLTN